MSEAKPRLIVAMTGATGAVYGKRMLEILRETNCWETHLVVSGAGFINLKHELDMGRNEIHALADVVYKVDDVAAAIASGAFKVEGMVVAPCSMKTLAAIAHGLSDNLIARAADVTLKERRRLVIMPRETPLNLAHIRNMASVTEMGGIIYPPMPAFYGGAKTLDALIDETVGRVLGLFGIDIPHLFQPWEGL
ncbi:UbiX family flavin prenyltransferase [Candidatus Methylospira mobilis]|uniref:Flavin prenyltransferase UbiX n=1 Tax=Candidatus Methylospira mobilis TaxID=1808979 RepID=A0A5Q0BLY9_9GAMM|nr:UbiX family flavin prenyltransferase [Candidatus Methylospira mobilis]QFY44152.1 UbiX family flavin prenyltransferase [Candidatus Methylospira mobilis]WNV06429.1 UbiX family flavin prenyltransferase [Candidatus Methylospira mobilis]